MEFEELSKFLKSGKVAGTNNSSTSLDLNDPPSSYEHFRDAIYQYPSGTQRSWSDYPNSAAIAKRRRPVPGVSRLVQHVRKFRKESSSRLAKQYDDGISSEEEVSDSDKNYKLSSMIESSTDLPFHQNTSTTNQKDLYQPVSGPRISGQPSSALFPGTSGTETSQISGNRPDLLRGIRSKSHVRLKESNPSRIWRRRHTGSPSKASGAALGINFTELNAAEQDIKIEHGDTHLESMTNIKAAMMNFSDLFTSQTVNSSNANEIPPNNLPSEVLVEELIHNLAYLRARMISEEEKIAQSRSEISSYIENLRDLDKDVEKLNSKVAVARVTSIPGMEQQLAEISQRNPDLKRARNVHIRTVKIIDQQNRRMADYPLKLTDLEKIIQAARRREAASMLMDKWGWPLGKSMKNLTMSRRRS
ncbi:hypothetical protein INT43_004454 [Umbelopsis isabellina]|uniref:Uncharacterized protein n=1 Tax=Mortierella isabellina TaxID=91625 RepID=A0A8H7PIA5_MORIS|nr:hypothetical protein INT43_004454 [Umbelopsis isabellina]